MSGRSAIPMLSQPDCATAGQRGMKGIEISRAEPARTRAAAWRRDEEDPAMPRNVAQAASTVTPPDARFLAGGPRPGRPR